MEHLHDDSTMTSTMNQKEAKIHLGWSELEPLEYQKGSTNRQLGPLVLYENIALYTFFSTFQLC